MGELVGGHDRMLWLERTASPQETMGRLDSNESAVVKNTLLYMVS